MESKTVFLVFFCIVSYCFIVSANKRDEISSLPCKEPYNEECGDFELLTLDSNGSVLTTNRGKHHTTITRRSNVDLSVVERRLWIDRNSSDPDHIKLLVVTEGNVIVCGRKNGGSCVAFDQETFEAKEELNQPNVVSSATEHDRHIGLIDDAGETEVLYVASPTTGLNDELHPLLSRRTLSNNSDTFLEIGRNDWNIPTSQILPPVSSCTSKSFPVAVFKHGGHIYSVVGDNNGTKLVRVCSRDRHFYSHGEFRLACAKQNDDKISSTLNNPTDAFMVEDHLYVAFSDNNISSTICMFDMAKVGKEFREIRRKCLEGKITMTVIEGYPPVACPSFSIPASMFNTSQVDEPDFCYTYEHAQPLGGRDPIRGSQLMVLPFKITAAVGFVSSECKQILVLGTENGSVQKFQMVIPFGTDPLFLESVLISDGREVKSLTVSSTGEFIYALSSSSVAKITADLSHKITARSAEFHSPTHRPGSTPSGGGSMFSKLCPLMSVIAACLSLLFKL